MKPNNSPSFSLRAKKSLGQNFIKDESVIINITAAAEEFLAKNKVDSANILEIGPGTGMLTKSLLQNPNRSTDIITGVEKDHRAISGLQNTVCKEYPERFILKDADILKYLPETADFCIGNIPYYITSDILMWLCTHKNKFLGAILMVQDEVADRLAASINSKEYSRLTVKMQLNFKITKLFKVSKECFVPQPKVNSAVIQLLPTDFGFENNEIEKEFESFTTLLFSQRRKMLRRTLGSMLSSKTLELQNLFWKNLEKLKIAPTDRPESITPENIYQFFKLYSELK